MTPVFYFTVREGVKGCAMLMEPPKDVRHLSRRMDGAPDKPEIIGGRIFAVRVAMGYEKAQGQFAKLVGITAPALANYESGDRRPELEALSKFRDRLGLPYEFLLHGEMRYVPHELANKVRPILRDLEAKQAQERQDDPKKG